MSKRPKFLFSPQNKRLLIILGTVFVLLNIALIILGNFAPSTNSFIRIYFVLKMLSIVANPAYIIYLVGSLIMAYNK